MAEPAHIPESAGRRWQLGPWQQIADGVHRLVAEPATVNLGLIVGSDGAVVVDAGSSPAQGAELLARVTEITDRPVRAVVATHDHFDHAFGLAGFPGIPTIGHETLAESLRADGIDEQARDLGFDPADLVVPDTLLAVADVVELGGQRVVEIVHLGEGHSRGDLVITVTDPGVEGFGGVIFAGDLIESAPADAPAPWFGPDTDIDQWSWTVDRLHGLAGEHTVIVPGHGDPVDRDFVREQRNAIDAVRVEIARLFAEGVPESDVLERGDWPFPAAHVAAGIAPGYAQLRAAAAQDPTAGDRRTLPLA